MWLRVMESEIGANLWEGLQILEMTLISDTFFNVGTRGSQKLKLEAGEHTFPFKFQIPDEELPAPYEGKYGQIRYMATATMRRSMTFDLEAEQLFSIVGSSIDLNTMPDASTPWNVEDEKTSCCLCCASGPIKMSVQTDKTGYAPGEIIFISGEIENNSSRAISKITAKFLQESHFRAQREGAGDEDTKDEKKTITKQETSGCDGNSSLTLDTIQITVPAVPPTGLDGCEIIAVKYHVEVEADISRTPFGLKIKLPVTIATKPLSGSSPTSNPPSSDGVITQQPTAMPGELAPPTYEHAAGGEKKIILKSGTVKFAPKYPCYHGNANNPPVDNNQPQAKDHNCDEDPVATTPEEPQAEDKHGVNHPEETKHQSSDHKLKATMNPMVLGQQVLRSHNQNTISKTNWTARA